MDGKLLSTYIGPQKLGPAPWPHAELEDVRVMCSRFRWAQQAPTEISEVMPRSVTGHGTYLVARLVLDGTPGRQTSSDFREVNFTRTIFPLPRD